MKEKIITQNDSEITNTDVMEQAERGITLFERIVAIVKNIFEIFKSGKQNKIKEKE